MRDEQEIERVIGDVDGSLVVKAAAADRTGNSVNRIRKRQKRSPQGNLRAGALGRQQFIRRYYMWCARPASRCDIKVRWHEMRHFVRPTHPGEFIRTEVLEPLDLDVTKAAHILDVRRATLSDLVNGKAALSPEMALRIEKAFAVSMDMLLRMQALWDASAMRERADTISVQRYTPAPT